MRYVVHVSRVELYGFAFPSHVMSGANVIVSLTTSAQILKGLQHLEFLSHRIVPIHSLMYLLRLKPERIYNHSWND